MKKRRNDVTDHNTHFLFFPSFPPSLLLFVECDARKRQIKVLLLCFSIFFHTFQSYFVAFPAGLTPDHPTMQAANVQYAHQPALRIPGKQVAV